MAQYRIHPKVATASRRLARMAGNDPDADLTNERRDLAAVKLEAAIERIVDEAPPLTDGQRLKLIALLTKSEHQ